jgi:hypothetical protein
VYFHPGPKSPQARPPPGPPAPPGPQIPQPTSPPCQGQPVTVTAPVGHALVLPPRPPHQSGASVGCEYEYVKVPDEVQAVQAEQSEAEMEVKVLYADTASPVQAADTQEPIGLASEPQ